MSEDRHYYLTELERLLKEISSELPDEFEFFVIANHIGLDGNVDDTLEFKMMNSQALKGTEKILHQYQSLMTEIDKYKHFLHHKQGFYVFCVNTDKMPGFIEGKKYRVSNILISRDSLCFEIADMPSPEGFDGYSSLRFKLFDYHLNN